MITDSRSLVVFRLLRRARSWWATWRSSGGAGTQSRRETPPLPAILPIGRRLAILYCLFIAWQAVQAAAHPLWPRGVALWVAGALYVALFLFASRRVSLSAVLAAGALAVTMQVIDAAAPASVAAFGAVALAGGRLALPLAGVASILIGGCLLAAQALTPPHPGTGALLSQFTGLAFTCIAMASLARLRAEQRRTAALLAEVLAGRDAQVRAAALDERAHLAREVHDVLAHTLSALSIQIEGARMLAEERQCDPAVVSNLERVTRLAREGLLEARRAVSSLRGDALPGPDLLPALVEAFERDTATPCVMLVEGEERDLPSEARLALFRTAQEALTNIRKHAEATAVTIRLRYSAGDVDLLVENQGSARPAQPLDGGGFGLVGMRERAELLGGRLEAGPTAAGYRVRLWIPV